jgi:hypothetical protein
MEELQRSKGKAQLQQEVQEEFARRSAEHRTKVNQANAHRHYRETRGIAATTAPLDFLAIGDSWFDYPVNDWGVLWPNQDIIAQLQTIGTPSPIILSRAVHGQAMTTVMGLPNQKQYVNDIADPTQWIGGKPDAILLSGGGDDMVGDQFVVYLDYFGGQLSARLQGIIDSVEASYEALFQFRDLYAPGTPIFGHCYDYAIPNGSGVLFAGPWLKPSLDFTSYTYADGLTIVKNAIDKFHDMLDGLSGNKKNNFILVDTRGTLTRDTSHPLGWANEIHPYSAGFIALAKKFVPAIQTVFPHRI